MFYKEVNTGNIADNLMFLFVFESCFVFVFIIWFFVKSLITPKDIELDYKNIPTDPEVQKWIREYYKNVDLLDLLNRGGEINEACKKLIILKNLNIFKNLAVATHIHSYLNEGVSKKQVFNERAKGITVFDIPYKIPKEVALNSIGNILVDDSKKSLDTMNQVNSVIEKLNINIDSTKEIFNSVNEGIGYSADGLNKIQEQTAGIDKARSSMMKVMGDLQDVSEKNIKYATDTEEVTKHIGKLFDEIGNIKEMTENLVDSVKIFEV